MVVTDCPFIGSNTANGLKSIADHLRTGIMEILGCWVFGLNNTGRGGTMFNIKTLALIAQSQLKPSFSKLPLGNGTFGKLCFHCSELHRLD